VVGWRVARKAWFQKYGMTAFRPRINGEILTVCFPACIEVDQVRRPRFTLEDEVFFGNR
jgi:hypothetical protein